MNDVSYRASEMGYAAFTWNVSIPVRDGPNNYIKSLWGFREEQVLWTRDLRRRFQCGCRVMLEQRSTLFRQSFEMVVRK